MTSLTFGRKSRTVRFLYCVDTVKSYQGLNQERSSTVLMNLRVRSVPASYPLPAGDRYVLHLDAALHVYVLHDYVHTTGAMHVCSGAWK